MYRRFRLVQGLLLGVTLYAAARAQRAEFIFTEAPFPSAHASTIVSLRSHDLMAAWFGGTKEGASDVAIWGSNRSARGWSAPQELVREPGVPCWNPVLFYSADGRLWLYYKFGPDFRWWTAGRRFSDNDGKTWSAVEHLTAGLLGPIRAKPLLLKDGTLVAGSSVEAYSSWAAWIDRSRDNGKHWTVSGPITLPSLEASTTTLPADKLASPTGIIQPSVISMGGKRLRLYARSTEDIGHICIADSADAGVTWSAARALSLPNPNSGIDVVRLKDGRIVMIYNDTAHGRTPLNLAVSRDGENFSNFMTLESEAGEFSYPALIQGPEGDLHMTYTFNRKRIRYVRVPLSAVPSAKETR